MTTPSQDELLNIVPIAFDLGVIVATRGVDAFIDGNYVALIPLLNRHINCDWGDCPKEDAISNNWATHKGNRIHSSYELNGEKIWIITEHDRSVTTILFPSEY
ncbi:type I restriction endonuclease subunit M (plasmid) [Photobacterium damselae]|uniref:type I restriction endonuclease subunit M n=1 Tax=Photobacterium damselae TaxID=38293 RepID=UPI002543B04C